MASTNFENATLRLLIEDVDGIVTTASLTQTDSPSGGGIGGSIADKQVAFGNGTNISGSNLLKFDRSANFNNGALIFNSDTPATQGFIRTPNAFSVFGRNNSDDADVQLLLWNGNDVTLGGDIDKCVISFQANGELDITSATDAGDVNIASPAGNTYLQSFLGDIYLYALSGAVEIHDILKLTPTTEPVSPEEGMVYAGTDHHLYYYNGTTWKQLDN